MNIGAIYYTDNRLDPDMMKICQDQIKKGFEGEIISASLKPISFGKNIVLDIEPGILTYLKQILTALENSSADFVFFLEHDVVYSSSHFDFTPKNLNTFYYNTNVWKWDYPHDRLITYDVLRSLSGMCCGREFAIAHYKKRIQRIEKDGWQLKFGFEPGTKRRRRGGITDDFCVDWSSERPNVDIRHKGTLSPRKCDINKFKHKPSEESWKEGHLGIITEWDLKTMFNIK
jgi:hypothetical protein